MLTSAPLRRSFLKWVSVLHKSIRMFSWRIKKKRRTAAGLSLFKSTINHGEGEEYDRPVIHHAAQTPFQMVIGLSVSPIVTAVSRQRGVATPQRGGRAAPLKLAARRRETTLSGRQKRKQLRARGFQSCNLYSCGGISSTEE